MSVSVRMGLCLCCALLFAGRIKAQEVVPSLKADTNRIKIGEQITLTLTLSQPASLPVAWPVFTDSLGGMEVVAVQPPDTLETDDDKLLLRSQTLKVSAFDSGVFQIPPVAFTFRSPNGGKPISIETDPLWIQVFSVPVDTTKDIRDIRGIEKLPTDYTPWLIGAGLVLLLALLGWWLYRRYLKRKAALAALPQAVVLRPPHEVALEQLRELEQQRIWQQGLVKQYYTRLTDILRHYLELRWMVQAMELTSDEIMAHSFTQLLSTQAKEDLTRVLLQADLVKFAKAEPLPQDNEMMMALAVRFVNDTTRQEITAISNPDTE